MSESHATHPGHPRRKLPPIWLMGLTNCTWGLMGGFAIITLPQLLAAQGVPGGALLAFTSTLLWPSTIVAFVSPILDVHFSRRTYAIATAVLTAVAVVFSVTHNSHFRLIEIVMVAGYSAAALYQGAVGGWMGSLIDPKDDGKLGVWFAVSNTGAAGITALLGATLVSRFGTHVAAVCLAAVLLLPTLLFLFIPAPGPDRKLASESFGQFWGDIAALMKRREVVIAMLLFVLPSASFALTNALAGWGKDFSASEHLVSFAAGTGALIAGIAGSFALQPLAKFFPLRPIYLGVGIIGGLFTLSLLVLPHTPTVFAIAFTGENIFQALAFATANAISFETMGPGNPLAATLFTVLIAITNLPIIYMGYIDSAAYDYAGVRGSLISDACISIVVCTTLWWLLFRLKKKPLRSEEAAT